MIDIVMIARCGTLEELEEILLVSGGFHPARLVDCLAAAAFRGSVPHVTALLDAGADPAGKSESGSSGPLFCAIESGDPGIIQILVEAGAPINQPYDTGMLPLQHAIDYEVDAAQQCHEPLRCHLTNKLLELGADSKQRDVNGQSCVETARQRGHVVFLRLLESNSGNSDDDLSF